MRKIFVNLILSMFMLTSVAFASDNSLNSVLLEGSDKGYKLVLRTDKVTQVKKSVQPDGALLIDLKNTSVSKQEIKKVLPSFLGKQKQLPPIFSALPRVFLRLIRGPATAFPA